MAVNPLGSGGVNEPGQKRVGGVAPAGSNPAPAGRDVDADSVELSAEALRLAAPDIPEGTLDAERLRIISQRIADGSYNADTAMDAIARKVAGELS
ncbi:MAG TPA: flagellar biosynthesis anti-sigma factor FlgM [Gemmatimonadales bacterium]|nr:flagellar biosynthesis anti-sigma factor FlgM [Gemmatimonadales bacterium]